MLEFHIMKNPNINLPLEFENRMKLLLGESYNDFLLSFDAPKSKALQLHPQETSMNLIQNNVAEITPIPNLENTYYSELDHIGWHPYHHAGIFYSQDPAAMLPIGSFEINPDSYVLDLCAAPGGKSSQIASILETGKGFLVSNEINPQRNKILVSNMERMGYKNVLVTKLSAEELASEYPAYFDLILVDAPCSGEGMFRKYPESVTEWSIANVDLCQNRQKEILSAILACLKPGGNLIYSTCTYSPEENENIVSYLVNKENLRLLPVNKKYSANLTNLSAQILTDEFYNTFKIENDLQPVIDCCYRFYPHRGNGEGQFFAHLQKSGNNLIQNHSTVIPLKKITSKNYKLIAETMNEQLSYFKDNLYEFEDKILIIPNGYGKLPSHGISKCGVIAGEIQKNRFVPHHNLFRAYGGQFKNRLSLPFQDERIRKYLNGQEISDEQTPNGYGVLCVDDTPLGGYKSSNGRLKNHYPKALRNLTY